MSDKEWFLKLEEIHSQFNAFKASKFGNDLPVLFFRGVSDEKYDLLPGRFRSENLSKLTTKNVPLIEFDSNSYAYFQSYGISLLDKDVTDWDVLFCMQHYGIPTRLLDWTESLNIALYFALKNAQPGINAKIYVLDPYGLNRIASTGKIISSILDPNDYFKGLYYQCFVEFSKKFEFEYASLFPTRKNTRQVLQNSVFTFHQLDMPLNKNPNYQSVLLEIVIEHKYFEVARKYLSNTGINEFVLFHDLDGLGRLIKEKYF